MVRTPRVLDEFRGRALTRSSQWRQQFPSSLRCSALSVRMCSPPVPHRRLDQGRGDAPGKMRRSSNQQSCDHWALGIKAFRDLSLPSSGLDIALQACLGGDNTDKQTRHGGCPAAGVWRGGVCSGKAGPRRARNISRSTPPTPGAHSCLQAVPTKPPALKRELTPSVLFASAFRLPRPWPLPPAWIPFSTQLPSCFGVEAIDPTSLHLQPRGRRQPGQPWLACPAITYCAPVVLLWFASGIASIL